MRALPALALVWAVSWALGACAGLTFGPSAAQAPAATAQPAKTTASILQDSTAAEWRGLDLDNTLVMDLGGGREVVIELAPSMAPLATANIKTLARARFFDGLSINRVQDNFVTQWGDPEEGDKARALGAAAKTIAPEFDRPIAGGPAFQRLPDRDVYAPEVGFVGAFPAARSQAEGRMWLTHCYASVGVGRGNEPESGNGAELYAVIGHSPRQLDRNINVVGRVVWGIDALSALPRGTGALGFYENPSQRSPIRSIRVASELPNGGLAGGLEALRTDSASFQALIEARRNRKDAWYLRPAGQIDLCSVLLPVRKRP